MANKLAVIFGGSGFIGRHVVRELAKRGWRVRVGIRRPHLAHYLKPLGTVGQIQLVSANLQNPASLDRALTGADAVVNLVGVLASRRGQSFNAIHTEGAASLARAARAAGIENFIQVSAIGADIKSNSAYARSKAAGEEAVLHALPTAKILRPSIVFGPRDSFFNRFAKMAMMSPFLPLIGGGHTKFQPVYVNDIAEAIAAALEGAGRAGSIFELGGPQIYSFKELMAFLLKTTERQRLLLPVPFKVAQAMGTIGDLINIIPFLEAPITRDQVELLKSNNIVSMPDTNDLEHQTASQTSLSSSPKQEQNDLELCAPGTFEDLGITPTTVEAILPSYMVQFRKYGQFASDTA